MQNHRQIIRTKLYQRIINPGRLTRSLRVFNFDPFAGFCSAQGDDRRTTWESAHHRIHGIGARTDIYLTVRSLRGRYDRADNPFC